MIVNILLFQLGWFASVIGASQHAPWLGVLAVAFLLIVHLATRGTPGELRLVVASALMGVLVDSLLLHTGLFSYASRTYPDGLAPAWIVAMWANFSMTLRHSLAWLSHRRGLAATLGALFGPLAYWGAASLGAVQIAWPMVSMVVLAFAWGTALPTLFWLSEKFRERPLRVPCRWTMCSRSP